MSESVYHQKAWNLNELFSGFDDPVYETAYKQAEELTQNFVAHRTELNPEISKETFLAIVKEYDKLSELGTRIYGFAMLNFAANTQDQKAQNAIARVQQAFAKLENDTLFFSLWWKGLDDENAQRLQSASGDYAYYLQQLRNFKPYTLSEAEEKIINIKNTTGVSVLNTLYDSITNRYTFKLEGQEKPLTREELMTFVQSADAELRAKAYQELYRVYGQDESILGQIYQAIVRDWQNENVDLRGFKNPIATRNTANNIPDQVIDTLLEVARKNAGIFQRFFKYKANLLGMEKLRRYDIYAPVSQAEKQKYTFEEGWALTKEAYNRFDPEFARLAERILSEDHCDSEVREGKMGGAFCMTLTSHLTPWVLLNYQGRERDLATIAHEFGHAVHSMLSEHLPTLTQNACLPLAETASTFGEMALTDLLLEREHEPSAKRGILFRQVEDAYATVMRQIYFCLFERQAHEMSKNGASISELSAAYMDNLHEMFGDSLEVADEFRYEWTSIPHIYSTPFYVYAYAFGQLLVYALYQMYKQEGESFKPKYKRILSAGGSIAPVELLKEAGIDVTQASFWQGGFNLIDEMVKELETL